MLDMVKRQQAAKHDGTAGPQRCCGWGRTSCQCSRAAANASSAAQVTPLLAELRSGNVVANLEALTASAADAARDLHKLQNEARPPRMHRCSAFYQSVRWHRVLCAGMFGALSVVTKRRLHAVALLALGLPALLPGDSHCIDDPSSTGQRDALLWWRRC